MIRTRFGGGIFFANRNHKPYITAVEDAFGSDVDYAVLQKLYGADAESEKRYSPAKCIGVKCDTIQGNPNRSTSARPTWSGQI